MKITTKDHKNYINLYDIDSGEVFRPVNSQRVFMKLWNELSDDCWNECESRLYNYYENPQEQELNDICDEGRATGEIIIFHMSLRVVKLKYAMEVEG